MNSCAALGKSKICSVAATLRPWQNCRCQEVSPLTDGQKGIRTSSTKRHGLGCPERAPVVYGSVGNLSALSHAEAIGAIAALLAQFANAAHAGRLGPPAAACRT